MLKKWVLQFLVLCLSLMVITTAQADTLRISQMEISIWPEYDRPETLVIYRISFSSLTDFPARVSIRIPSSSGTPYLVAMKDLDGLLYDLEYTLVSDGSWNRIEFITSSPDLQIEFYDPVIQLTDAKHEYGYRWVSDYPIDALTLEVQKPKFATTMTTEPDLGVGVVNTDDGLTYYTADIGEISQGVILNLKLSYLKTNDELSASLMTVHAVNPIENQNAPMYIGKEILQSVVENQTLTTTIVLLLAAILLFIVVSLLSSRFNKVRLPVRKTKPNEESDPAESVEKSQVYCHQCGKRARPGDLFCRVCGSKLIQS
ncbi:MAG: zinc ribbon domain-containing protein [Anaerolineaceae bacterium]|nr:zinc ribbon domain-containing protein [Anaerolineaceae bacterium]